MSISNTLGREKVGHFLFYLILVIVAMLVPLSYVYATSIGTNVSVTGTLTVTGASTFNGSVTVGDATTDTLTVTARLAADLDPNANNTIDLGAFSFAYKDIYVSSTAFVGDLSDLLYVDKVNSRIGISSSTPSAKLSIGTVNTSSTIDVPQLCFRTTVDVAGTDTQLYYWPCNGTACPTVAMQATGWATSTASCF
ncbi:MAG: hypothetical protein A3A89_01830 [Candidatus Magasanikbacteria bacterium RIFCSPLOWO2_01_FULL_33_34]|nr:MAG: hypothetical protein A3A89_01830 [Candidatus Magasanikbacteria bacterium RIFCSPLOWO2_01_FULL_33_34]